MNWLNPIKDLVSGIAQPALTYMTRRAELKAQKHENEMKRLQAEGERQHSLAVQGMTADANWEMEFARQAASSWKDEYTLLVVSIPLVMAFIPGMAPIVAAGFAAFSATPIWYQVMVQAIFYATYGMRAFNKFRSDT